MGNAHLFQTPANLPLAGKLSRPYYCLDTVNSAEARQYREKSAGHFYRIRENTMPAVARQRPRPARKKPAAPIGSKKLPVADVPWLTELREAIGRNLAANLQRLVGDNRPLDVARETKLSKNAIYRAFKNQGDSYCVTVLILARHFGVSIDELLADPPAEKSIGELLQQPKR